MILQARDRAILRSCYEQQFLLIEHVQRYFFGDCHRRKADERIQELVREGLLLRDGFLKSRGRPVIRLSPKGRKLVEAEHPIGGIPYVRRLDLTTLEHDAIVTSVALRLAEVWDGVWVPERALKKDEFSTIPDGVFVFTATGSKVAVEVENSLKGKTRFMGLLDRWRGTKMRVVLFVPTKYDVEAKLREWIADGPKGVPFALVGWPSLRDGKPYAWSPKGALDLFNRRTL